MILIINHVSKRNIICYYIIYNIINYVIISVRLYIENSITFLIRQRWMFGVVMGWSFFLSESSRKKFIWQTYFSVFGSYKAAFKSKLVKRNPTTANEHSNCKRTLSPGHSSNTISTSYPLLWLPSEKLRYNYPCDICCK